MRKHRSKSGKAPSVSHLRVFGSNAFMHIDKQFRKKFDPKAKKLIMVGYQGDSANYRLYDPSTRRVSVSRDVVFKKEQLGESSAKNEVSNEYTFPNYKEDEREALEEAGDNEPDVPYQQREEGAAEPVDQERIERGRAHTKPTTSRSKLDQDACQDMRSI